MLLSEDVALWIVRDGLSIDEAARRFGISQQMVSYRINGTGARTRIAKARKFRIVS